MLIKHISQTKERPGGDFFYLANSRWSGNVVKQTTTIMIIQYSVLRLQVLKQVDSLTIRPPLQKLLKI